ncbi:selenium cofactor biosynthesis protein YqeC [Anaerostipes sp.]|uniref:selenium cofactor biosynthesis protein YqeC n=1 Tax=Anaerostipes sp. TaxID=1872530 RepID=UPI0025C6C6D8|nr:selenium cofactor biosynthesis protein YqeC [Anaerostipes sp.]MBS7007761.1 putative selenium-dependent hydroxylase accessory protein YqeC [Anaerostipes sp.]
MKSIGKKDSLSEALGIRDGILAVTGAGGKTTSVFLIAGEQAAAGKKVLVTTTTHMEIPEQHTLLSGDAAEIRERLISGQVLTAGLPEGEKMKGLSKDVFQEAVLYADLTVVEADGAKKLPLKARNETEPVIPEGTSHILVVAGMRALGRPIGEVCHRPELACRLLQKSCKDFVKCEDFVRLIQDGYVIMLRKQYPDAVLSILLNQCDTKELTEKAARIGAHFDCRYPVILR